MTSTNIVHCCFCRRSLHEPAAGAAPHAGPVLEADGARRRARLLSRAGARPEPPPAELRRFRLFRLLGARTRSRRARARGGARLSRAAHRSPAPHRAPPRARRAAGGRRAQQRPHLRLLLAAHR